MLNLLQYSLVSLVIFLGLVIGFILAVCAKEELKPGRKYFILLQHIILFLIIAGFFYFNINDFSLFLLVSIVSGFFIFYNYEKVKNFNINRPYLMYAFFAIIFYLSYKKIDLFSVESSLMFIYGLPSGSLLTNAGDKMKSLLRIAYNLSFIAVALLLFAVF